MKIMHSIVPEINSIAEQPLLDGLPVAIMIADAQGIIHYHNTEAELLLGSKQQVPHSLFQLSKSFSQEDFLKAIKTQNQPSNNAFETLIFPDKNKRNRPYRLKIVAYPENPHFYLISMTKIIANDFQDYAKYTLLKKNFKELKQFSRLSAMREISSSLADKLNQPLTAILSYTQAMQRLYQNQSSSEEIYDAMERVVVNAEHAGQIIRQIRAQININTLHCKPHCINDLIKQSVHLTELDNVGSAIKLSTDYESDNTMLSVDATQLKQVFLSLLHNAIDAVLTEDNHSPEITLSTDVEHGQYVIRIDDNGPGIPEAIQNKIFEPFFTTKESGIGIGLSMCNYIIDLHKGSISISSHTALEPDTGTLATIYLPLEEAL